MIRLAVRLASADAEAVLAPLIALAPGGGLEERDLPGGQVEYVFYGAPEELPAPADLRAAAGGAEVEIAVSEIGDDWEKRWKDFHPPVEVRAGKRQVRVRPPWEPAGEGIDIVIEPGQAFGTGAHETTRLCLELLLEREPGGALADWGCGSGVLAIAAARLGWAPVVACDHDAPSVAAARRNAADNGVPGIAVAEADLRREPGPWAPTVLANLHGSLLLDVAARLARPPEEMIVSGIERHEAVEVAAAFARAGLREAGRRGRGNWTALRLLRQ